MYVMPTSGGAARKVAATPRRIMSKPSWSPDGKRLAFEVRGGIATVAVTGGDVTHVRGTVRDDASPAWAPGGREIAFVRFRRTTGLNTHDVWAANIRTGRPRSSFAMARRLPGRPTVGRSHSGATGRPSRARSGPRAATALRVRGERAGSRRATSAPPGRRTGATSRSFGPTTGRLRSTRGCGSSPSQVALQAGSPWESRRSRGGRVPQLDCSCRAWEHRRRWKRSRRAPATPGKGLCGSLT